MREAELRRWKGGGVPRTKSFLPVVLLAYRGVHLTLYALRVIKRGA